MRLQLLLVRLQKPNDWPILVNFPKADVRQLAWASNVQCNIFFFIFSFDNRCGIWLPIWIHVPALFVWKLKVKWWLRQMYPYLYSEKLQPILLNGHGLRSFYFFLFFRCYLNSAYIRVDVVLYYLLLALKRTISTSY